MEVKNLHVKCVAKLATLLSIVGKEFRRIIVVQKNLLMSPLAIMVLTLDTNWYADSGATDHITGNLDKLHVRDRYDGNEQIHTSSGSCIHHIGHSVIHTPTHDLHLATG
jgi:hypothetical protein